MVGDFPARQHLQPLQQGIGLGAAMGFDIADHHVAAVLLALPGRLQHGIGLADAGGIAEKDLQLAQLGRDLFGLGQLEHRLRGGAYVVTVSGHQRTKLRSFRWNFICVFVEKKFVLRRKPLQQVNRTIRVLKPQIAGI